MKRAMQVVRHQAGGGRRGCGGERQERREHIVLVDDARVGDTEFFAGGLDAFDVSGDEDDPGWIVADSVQASRTHAESAAPVLTACLVASGPVCSTWSRRPAIAESPDRGRICALGIVTRRPVQLGEHAVVVLGPGDETGLARWRQESSPFLAS